MSLPLSYRAIRHALPANSIRAVSCNNFSIRNASTSAVHEGLFRSEKARPQGPRPGRLAPTSDSSKRLTYAERKKMREELAKQRPTFKIRKGKKDITEYPDEVKPPSRKARFYDPNDPFGKKSLVYQLKSGLLSDQLKELHKENRAEERLDSTSQSRSGSRQGRGASRSDRNSRDARGSRREAHDDSPMSDDQFRAAMGSSPAEQPTRAARAARPTRTVHRQPTPDRNREAPLFDFDRGESRDRAPRRTLEPLSIPYSTAASQFLYGRSTVEAALRASRRKLYKLYIYDGPNRRITSDNALIQTLAKRKGVPVTILTDDKGLRLMDKMAASRPHNGFVLEASPLPQPPLASLGPVPESESEYASRPGFPIVLGHQSAEEAAVNGTRTFIPSPSATHKPLVVVLDQILDPGNLGAILRTVSFLGATAVAITRHGTASITPVALKASAGAAEALDLFFINSLPEFLAASRENGWAVFAAVAEGPRGSGASAAKQRRYMDLHGLEEMDPLKREPCVLLIGNEGEGLNRLVVKKADYEVNIPNLSGSTAVDSLNVSVAAGLLCSAFLKGMGRERFKLGGVEGAVSAKGGDAILW
ncbi:hypothetical protein N656DRAFT_788853 [Canariomyces notabilis]|uniref:rRNA methyltransferase 1, mitochondrial n=1 Tax=Canariomyces notabilis TaxID=2074819 RepID=A0AAN6YU96_9PEZI|nr:hypothetical protein N656DRAFT_788853 [Canariomyces arenarius]